jgi:hypothetical protein
MAVPSEGVKRWFRDSNGKVSQVNNVLEITFASPLIAEGHYRDEPPVVVGGASVAGISGGSVLNARIAGGVNPTTSAVSVSAQVNAKGASSTLQDDNFLHTPLRFIWAPMSLVFFRTWNGLTATNPDGTTFALARPTLDFEVFNVDCVFDWGEDCSIFNAAPPGWSVGESDAPVPPIPPVPPFNPVLITETHVYYLTPSGRYLKIAGANVPTIP